MIKTQKTLRKVFQPLSVMSYVEVSGANPVQQYNSLTKTYTPDYTNEDTRLVLKPVIIANTDDADTSWTNGPVNDLLFMGLLQWTVNGKDISTIGWVEGTDYTIDKSSSGNTRGTLTIMRNLPSDTFYDFAFKSKFADSRINKPIVVQTDIVNVGCSSVGDDEIDFTVVSDATVAYDPFLDKLNDYFWRIKYKGEKGSPARLQRCFDGNQYHRSIPFVISSGAYVIDNTDILEDNFEIKVFCPVDGEEGGSSYEEIKVSDNLFVKSISVTKMAIDCRLIPDGTPLNVRLYKKDGDSLTELKRLTVTFARRIPDYKCEPTNESMFELYNPSFPKTKYRYDRARLTCHGKVYEYPEEYLEMGWYTYTWKTSTTETICFHGYGPSINIDMEEANIIGTGSDCYLRTEIQHELILVPESIGYENGVKHVFNYSGDFLKESDSLIVIDNE